MRSYRGEGGEQGDALMPAMFSLGQHSALEAIQARLRLDESLMAFMDDIYAKSNPKQVCVSVHSNPRRASEGGHSSA